MRNDAIEREIEIAAPIERVWSVLTEPEHVGTWFGTGTPNKIDLRPGGVMELDHGPHGVYLTTIETVEPPHTFSYWWASAFPNVQATKDNATLVVFTLKETDTGTLLRVVESGFATLEIPAERVDSAGYESHSEGWSAVIAKVGHYIDGSDVGALLPTA